MTLDKIVKEAALADYHAGGKWRDICAMYGISQQTLGRWIRETEIRPTEDTEKVPVELQQLAKYKNKTVKRLAQAVIEKVSKK